MHHPHLYPDLTYVNESKFAMGYNEPDHDGSWVPPDWAAEQWVRMEQMQDAYGLEVRGSGCAWSRCKMPMGWR